MNQFVPEEKVVEILRKEYASWVACLSSEEYHAIRKYSFNSFDETPNRFFERLNSMLRDGARIGETEMLASYAEIISTAIKKHPLEHNIVCYRGTNVDPTTDFNIDDVFCLSQFTSTSVIKSRVLNKKHMLTIIAPEGSCGAYIERVSCFPKQREFLFDKDCFYQMIARKDGEAVLEVITYDRIYPEN